MHPLAPQLTEVKLDELEKKRNELATNLNRCYQSGRGHMAQQIQMLLMDYEEEIQRRHNAILEQGQQDNESLASKIDIGK